MGKYNTIVVTLLGAAFLGLTASPASAQLFSGGGSTSVPGGVGAALDYAMRTTEDGETYYAIVGSPSNDPGVGGVVWLVESSFGLFGSEILYPAGEAVDASFGFAVANAGDIDGDGADDILVGEPLFDGESGVDSGRVWLFSGATRKPLANFEGDVANAMFGWSVDGGSDVDLAPDSLPDFLVGAPGEGRAYLLSGNKGKLISIVESNHADDRLGHVVRFAGDADNDGNDNEFVVAAVSGEDSSGYVWLCKYSHSAITAPSIQIQGSPSFGSSVDAGFNIDGDDFGDVVIGEPGRDQAIVVSWKDGSILLKLRGEPGELFGTSVSGGEFTGGGSDEIAVGAPMAANKREPGYVNVYSGSTGDVLQSYIGAFQSGFGSTVSIVRLQDSGDAHAIIGAPDANLVQSVDLGGAVDEFKP